MSSVSDFFIATIDQRLPLLCDEVIDANELMAYLSEKGCFKYGCGGDGFSFTARKERSAIFHAVGDWSNGQAKTLATRQKISGDYRKYAGEIMQSRFQLKRNEGAGNGKVYDLWEEALNEFMQDCEDYLGNDIYADATQASTDEDTPMEGLDSIVETSNTHFGIARSSNAWWQANERTVTNNFLDDDDADGVVNGIVSMRLGYLDASAMGDVSQSGTSKTIKVKKAKPDAIFTTLTSFNNYCLALQPQQQYVGGKNDVGQEVAFWGIPLRWDSYCTADKMYILNSKFLQIRVVGDSLIYRDLEDELGAAGTPRARAVGMASQLQFFSMQPRGLAKINNTD